jgi:hypothetical protein
MKFLASLICAGAALTLLAAAPARNSGSALCVLTQADFARAGLHVNAKPSVNLDGPQNAYCTYSGKSGATGGVELDVYFPAGTTPDEVTNTVNATLGSDGPAAAKQYLKEHVPGADESLAALSLKDNGPAFAANLVRKGDLVFALSLPAGPNASRQLLQLSKLVLARIHV